MGHAPEQPVPTEGEVPAVAAADSTTDDDAGVPVVMVSPDPGTAPESAEDHVQQKKSPFSVAAFLKWLLNLRKKSKNHESDVMVSVVVVPLWTKPLICEILYNMERNKRARRAAAYCRHPVRGRPGASCPPRPFSQGASQEGEGLLADPATPWRCAAQRGDRRFRHLAAVPRGAGHDALLPRGARQAAAGRQRRAVRSAGRVRLVAGRGPRLLLAVTVPRAERARARVPAGARWRQAAPRRARRLPAPALTSHHVPRRPPPGARLGSARHVSPVGRRRFVAAAGNTSG